MNEKWIIIIYDIYRCYIHTYVQAKYGIKKRVLLYWQPKNIIVPGRQNNVLTDRTQSEGESKRT